MECPYQACRNGISTLEHDAGSRYSIYVNNKCKAINAHTIPSYNEWVWASNTHWLVDLPIIHVTVQFHWKQLCRTPNNLLIVVGSSLSSSRRRMFRSINRRISCFLSWVEASMTSLNDIVRLALISDRSRSSLRSNAVTVAPYCLSSPV